MPTIDLSSASSARPARPLHFALPRSAARARARIFKDLQADRSLIRKTYRNFQKLDARADASAREALVRQVLSQLKVHAELEEELLYPAAREILTSAGQRELIDAAEVEHEWMRTLVDQLQSMHASDEKFAARFTVLCDYVLHHAREEEGKLFPMLEKAHLDWNMLLTEMNERRADLQAIEQGDSRFDLDDRWDENRPALWHFPVAPAGFTTPAPARHFSD